MQAQGHFTNISKMAPLPHKIYYYFRTVSNFQIYFKNSTRKILLESQKEKERARTSFTTKNKRRQNYDRNL